MTREQLEHAIRAACDVSEDSELWAFGSQAILGEFPNAPESLRTSIEVDVQPKNRLDALGTIDGALGELSQFHETHGFYVHGVPIESAVLPQGWEQRAKPVTDQISTRGNTGWCIEAHVLAASKLVGYREKDREFARTPGRGDDRRTGPYRTHSPTENRKAATTASSSLGTEHSQGIVLKEGGS